MIHLVYLDNKEKVLEKIMSGKKTMIIRGAAGRKIPHSRVFNDEVLYFMEKGTKFNLRQPTGEVKECKITRVKPSFFYFNIKNEYRFNTVLECLEKKVNDKWVECSEWENVIFAEDSGVENLSLNPFWTYHRRELAKIILFLTDKRSLSILYRIAYNLLDKSELQRYTAYTEGRTAG